MIQLVVCDLAGTTVYDGDGVSGCFRATLARWKIEADPAAINAVMGLPKPEAIRILLDQFGVSREVQPTPQTIAAMHEDFTQRMIAYYTNDPAIREIPGASATLATLRRAGIKVALNTGFFRPITGVLLERLGWRSPTVIDADISSDEVARGRPHPDMIQALMKRLGVSDPKRVAKVGDTPVDLQEGTNAGCSIVVGVATGSFKLEQLKAYPHTHLVDSIADIPQLLTVAS